MLGKEGKNSRGQLTFRAPSFFISCESLWSGLYPQEHYYYYYYYCFQIQLASSLYNRHK